MKKLMFLGAASALVWPCVLQAQTVTSSSPPDQPSSQTPHLAEIVVTAQRRSENVQTVPASIVAIPSSELEAAGVTTASDLTRITPGLNFAQSSFDTQPTIRGIGSRATGPGDESSVAVYVDGVYQTDMSDLDFDLNNVASIQVLEGPQGALYGRNATGGAIIVDLTKPSFTPVADVTFKFGSFNHAQLDARISGPLTDSLAGELDLTTYHEDGYIRDIVEGRDVGGERDVNLRASLLYKPNDRFSIQFNAHYSDRPCATCGLAGVFEGITQLQTAAPGTPIASAPWTTAEESHPAFKYLTNGGDIHLTYDFGPVLATLTTSYADDKTQIQFDTELGAPNLGFVNDLVTTVAYDTDIQLTSQRPGRLQWTAGIDQFNDRAQDPFTITADSFATSNVYNHPGCQLAVPVAATCNVIGVNQGAVTGVSIIGINSTQDVSATAAYVDGTYRIVGGLFVNAGVRFTREEHDFRDSLVFDGFPVAADTAPSKTWTNFSPHGSIRYQFPDGTNVYASVSTGFKSGLFNGLAPPPPNPVGPETVTAYELGVKTEIAHSVRVDASIFEEDYNDLQVQQSVSAADILLENAASAKIKGADLQIEWAPTDRFDARLGTEFLDARFTRFPNAAVEIPSLGASAAPNGLLSEVAGIGPIAGGQPFVPGVAGNWLIRTAPWTVDLQGAYHWPLFSGRLTLSASVYVSGPFYWDVANLFRQNSYALLAANINWQSDDHRWKLSVTGDNLTDAPVTSSLVLTNNAAGVNYIRPASVMGAITYSFF